jgi:demethylmenaquinone methyltransferase/2-methoxy-6-polyprenyl-1,4-benzoquinol methylase
MVPVDRYDPESVRRLFDGMAATYGRVNLLSSFGFTIGWRHQVVAGLPLASAARVVDLMSGMGELWRSLSPHLPGTATVVGVDFSEQMARRAPRDWPFTLEMHVADVLNPEVVPTAAADVVVSSFGLKTFNRDQQRLLARRVAQMLKEGGAYSFIEISVPRFAPLRALYMFYLKRVIPVIGRALLGNPDCYRMLGVYTEAFGNTSHFADCLRRTGLEAEETSYFLGCASGVRGTKPLRR